MISFLSLPIECHQHILHFLVEDRALGTLSSLLRTSQYLHAVTLPILYRNPFSLVPGIAYKDPNETQKIGRMVKLMRLLLQSLPDDSQVSPLLKAAYFFDRESNTPTNNNNNNNNNNNDNSNNARPSHPYYSFYTHIGFENSHSVFIISHLAKVNPSFRAFVFQSGFRQRAAAEYFFNGGDIAENIFPLAAQDLCRDFTWVMMCANAERIKSLVVPLSDIRYLLWVHRFGMLSGVTFILDKRMSLDMYKKRIEPRNYMEEGILQRFQTERVQHLEMMILFLTQHRTIHSGVLKNAWCRAGLNEGYEVCPDEYLLRLLRVLPPLVRPQYLGDHNWLQFVSKVQETDLSFVKEFSWFASAQSGIGSYEDLLAQGPFLHRCRSLLSLWTSFLTYDMFQWAVEERKQYDADVERGRLQPGSNLVPLQEVYISFDRTLTALERTLDDIAFSFRDSLESFSMRTDSHRVCRLEYQERRDLLIGGGGVGDTWDLPKLSTLQLRNTTVLPFRMKPDFLSRCPQLEHVTLEDERRLYAQGEIVYWSPAVLFLLTHLCLVGTPAISFHPETLRNTPKLVCLELKMKTPLFGLDNEDPARSYFEAVASTADSVEGEARNTTSTSHQHQQQNNHHLTRPIWVWNWDLPKLTILKLSGEFAYDFQFRMLDRTPSLNSLRLDTGYPEMFHRVVGVADFLKPGSKRIGDVDWEMMMKRGGDRSQEDEGRDRENEDEVWLGLEYMHVPALKSLTISAPWTIGGSSSIAGDVDHSSGRRMLKILFSKVAPNLESISLLNGVNGFGFEDWVELSSKYLLCLKDAYTTYRGREEDLGKYGLMKMPGARRKWSCCVVEPPEGREVGLPPAEYCVQWYC